MFKEIIAFIFFKIWHKIYCLWTLKEAKKKRERQTLYDVNKGNKDIKLSTQKLHNCPLKNPGEFFNKLFYNCANNTSYKAIIPNNVKDWYKRKQIHRRE